MKTYTHLSILILGILLFPLMTSAQTFSVSEVNTTQFPTLSAYFVALDYSGASLKDINATDFVVMENGKNLSSTVSVSCIDSITDPPISVSLVLDQSNSMNAVSNNGEPYYTWVKEGASSFINALNFSNGTQVEITGFSQKCRIWRYFTNDKAALLSTISGLAFAGGTNYNPPFLDSTNGAINRLRYYTSPSIRRVIVFLTDGDPESQFPTETTRIIEEAKASNIQVYAITLNVAMNDDLRMIAQNTGGKAFAVFTKEELNSVYSQIADDIKRKTICQISWTAPYGCSDEDAVRNTDITFTPFNKTVSTQYTAPMYSMSAIDVSPSIQYFDNPEIDTYVEKNIKITPSNTDITITGSNILPNTYFSVVDWNVGGTSKAPPFTIHKGETRTIKVRFTQKVNKTYRLAQLILESDPCPIAVDLVGGLSQVSIISPNGGEIYSTCDQVEIKWGGIEASTPVNLYYTTNGGSNWQLIASNVTGLTYTWKPPFPSTTYQVRAVVQTSSKVMWLNAFGSVDKEVVKGIVMHPNSKYFYVIGNHDGTFSIGGKTVQHRKGTDAFIAQFTTDGEIVWVKTITGVNDEVVNSLCVDPAGNLYITGTAYQGTMFDSYSPNITYANKSYMYIAKYNSDGIRTAMQVLAAQGGYSSFESTGTYIAFDSANSRVKVQGNYQNALQITAPPISLPKNYTKYTIIYDSSLSFKSVATSWFNSANTTSLQTYDSYGSKYTAENFTGTITRGEYMPKSNGETDIAIYKYGSTQSTNDISDKEFSVSKVSLTFTQSELNLDSCLIGETTSRIFTGVISNDGDITAYINSAALSNNTEFSLVTDLTGVGVLPHTSIPVIINFTPLVKGNASTTLTLTVECANAISLPVKGFGVCTYSISDSLAFSNTSINKSGSQTFSAVFTNRSPVPLQINPQIIGPDATYFNIVQPTVPLTVDANASVDFTVSFAPTEERLYTAYIVYNAPSECEYVDSTLLIGSGVNGDLIVSGCTFGAKRVATVNDNDINGVPAIATIYNQSEYPAIINTIDFADPTATAGMKFEITNLPSLPYSLGGNDSLQLNIRFIPQAEQAYKTTINVAIDGKTKTFDADVSGSGWIPNYEFMWNCPDPVKAGGESFGSLEVKSTDEKVGLTIHDIKFIGVSSDYTIVENTQNVALGIGESKTFAVRFNPKSAGLSSDAFVISTDATVGPETDPNIDSTYNVNCEVLGINVSEGINFGDLLVCDNATGSVVVTNTSASTDLIIVSHKFENNENNIFGTDLVDGTSVGPGKILSVNITFAPNVTVDFSATLILTTDTGEEIKFTLTGSASDFDLYSTQSQIKAKPNEKITIPVSAEIQDFANHEIKGFIFDVICDPTILKITGTTADDGIWTVKEVSSGTYRITCSANIPTPHSGNLVTLNGLVYLGDTTFTNIVLKPYFNACDGPDTLVSVLTLTGVCNLNYTKLEFTGASTIINAIIPNPVYDKVQIDYSVALNAPVKLELYNHLGERVAILVNESQDAGNHSIIYNAFETGNGTYFLRLTQGNISLVKSLIINK